VHYAIDAPAHGRYIGDIMKLISCEQGSAAWFTARLGKPTASGISSIITTEGCARKGTAPRRYMLELLGERLTRYPTQRVLTTAMQRGVDLEPRARAWYEVARSVAVQRVGFITSDCGRWGCSPDGLLPDRGIEIKCPMELGFVDVAESGWVPEDHFLQMQFGMWVTGLKQWDYVLFTDSRGLVPQIMTVVAESTLHERFAEVIPAFCDKLDEREKIMRQMGHGEIQEEVYIDDGKPLFDDE